MGVGYEKTAVYRLAIKHVAWVYEKAWSLTGIHRPVRDQWLRASQSILLKIAEGNGRTGEADRRRYFKIAPGSTLECAAIQNVLVVGKALDSEESRGRKTVRDRIVAMLSRWGGRGYCVKEDSAGYGIEELDSDPDKTISQRAWMLQAPTLRTGDACLVAACPR